MNVDYYPLLPELAQKYGVPENLARQVMTIESRGRNVVSPVGAVGPMQIMPSTAAGYGYTPQQLQDPRVATEAGVRYLADQFKRYHNIDTTMVAYNAGPGRANDFQRTRNIAGLPQETQGYLQKAHAMGGQANYGPATNQPQPAPPTTRPRQPAFNYGSGGQPVQQSSYSRPEPATRAAASFGQPESPSGDDPGAYKPLRFHQLDDLKDTF